MSFVNPTNNQTACISSHRIATEQDDPNSNRRTHRIYVGHGVSLTYK